MGFSREAIITMADGTFKNIDEIKVGEFIMDKRKRPTRVKANYKQTSQECVSFERDGDVSTVYCTPDQKFACVNMFLTSGKNVMINDYCTLSEMNSNNAFFKKDVNMFTTTSNIALNNYNATLVTKDVWSLDVSSSTKSFFVNTVIANKDGRI